jgi:hypothetical protein
MLRWQANVGHDWGRGDGRLQRLAKMEKLGEKLAGMEQRGAPLQSFLRLLVQGFCNYLSHAPFAAALLQLLHNVPLGVHAPACHCLCLCCVWMGHAFACMLVCLRARA